MECVLTYVHHNCFVLRMAGTTLLFDYPNPFPLPAGAAELTRELVTGADLVVFHSHSHEDHFTPEVRAFETLAARVRYALSWDVLDLHPEFGELENLAVLEPDEESVFDDFRIESFESTDLGVGMLIEFQGKRVWHGGDVALWTWPNLDQAALDFLTRNYEATLAALAVRRPDLAMVNADPRLENRAGAQLFLDRVQPRFLAPMHAFGDLDAVARFIADARPGATRLLGYSASGESVRLTL